MKILRRKIVLLGSMLSLASCMPNTSPPKDAIDESKMAAIIAEIHLTEAKVNKLNFQSYDSSRVAYRALEQRLFKKYGIDSAQYHHSYEFYVSNPDMMVDLYKKSIKILEEHKKSKKLD